MATIDDLRGKARKSYENFEGELRKQGCMVAGYRLLAEDGGLSEYCCKRLVEDWRTILRTRRGPRRRAWPPRRPCLLCGPRKDARDRHKRTAAPREARLLRGGHPSRLITCRVSSASAVAICGHSACEELGV